MNQQDISTLKQAISIVWAKLDEVDEIASSYELTDDIIDQQALLWDTANALKAFINAYSGE